MDKRFIETVLIHVIRHIVRTSPDLLTAAAHRNAEGAALEHRDVDLCIAKSDRIGNIRTQIAQERMDRTGLRYAFHSDITEQSGLPCSTLGAVLKIRELSLCVKIVLVAVQHVTYFI